MISLTTISPARSSRSKNGSADDRGELYFGEVLGRVSQSRYSVHHMEAYLSGISNFEEPSASIEDFGELSGRWIV